MNPEPTPIPPTPFPPPSPTERYECDGKTFTCHPAAVGYNTSKLCADGCVNPGPKVDVLLVNAQCDPHNDRCDASKGLHCDTSVYECRYIPTITANATAYTTATSRTAASEPDTVQAPAASGLPGYVYGIIIGASIFLLLLGVAVYVKARERTWKGLLAMYTSDGDGDSDGMQLLELVHQSSTNTTEYFDPEMTLDRRSIKLDKVVGEGNFGTVHSGTAKDPQRGNAVVRVAVKSPSADARLEFAAEMEIMGQLTRFGGHDHIVSVIGCVYGTRPLLVLEFCEGGSLKEALVASRENAKAAAAAAANGNPGTAGFPELLSAPKLSTFGYQVALAMAFLERHQLLHRDLAARNVLLTEHQICKLADFGLSRTLGGSSNDYYRRNVGVSAPIPVRWMAPETLDFNVSTIMSDKWSYGVLLWEIFSLARRPYAGVANAEVAKCVRDGHRLEQPKLCPDAIYALMLQCWSAEPEARPPFAQVGSVLLQQHGTHGSEV